MVVLMASIVAVLTLLYVRWRRERRRKAAQLAKEFGVLELNVMHYDNIPDHVYDRISNYHVSDAGYESVLGGVGKDMYMKIDDHYEQILEYELIARYQKIPDNDIARILNLSLEYEHPGIMITPYHTLEYGAAYGKVPEKDTAPQQRDDESRYEMVPHVNVAELLREAAMTLDGEDFYETAQTYERVPDASVTQILRQAAFEHVCRRAQIHNTQLLREFPDGVYERAQVYEKVPLCNIAQILERTATSSCEENCYGKVQTYEKVPDFDLLLLRAPGGEKLYESAQTYEKVPTVNIAQILRNLSYGEETYGRCRGIQNAYLEALQLPGDGASQLNKNCNEKVQNGGVTDMGQNAENHYESAQVYEKVPQVDLAQLLRVVPIYEQVVYDARTQMLFNNLLVIEQYVHKNTDSEEKTDEKYERICYGEMDKRGIVIFGEELSFEEDIQSEKKEESGIYERLHYSEEVEKVIQDFLAKDLSCDTAHERIQYSAEIEEMFDQIAAIQTSDKKVLKQD
jgi:hypothetical protein